MIISLLAQSMRKNIILISYLTNTEVYQKKCVNKARPKMHCNGKCQMAKKMQEEDNAEQKDPGKGFKYADFSFIKTPGFTGVEQAMLFDSYSKVFLQLSIGYTIERSRSFFRPPDIL